MTILTDSRSNALDSGYIVGAAFLDLRKAFDLVDHEILIAKLNAYKFDNSSSEWFRNYLTNRKQYISIANSSSSLSEVTCGVPQGSILGPLIFILFINDLPLNLVEESTIYADDTCIFTKSKLLEDVEVSLNKDLKNANEWMKENKMILNNEKTKCMLIATKQKSHKLRKNYIDLNVDGKNIECVANEKLLGMNIDSALSFTKHVSSLNSRISLRILALRRIKHFLPLFARKLFYNALILPHFEYCINVWSMCNGVTMERAFKLQKFAARTILDINNPSSIHSSELFKELNWLSLPYLAMYKKTVMVFKALHNTTPSYITDMFTRCTRNTRGQHTGQLLLPRVRTERHKRSFKFSAASAWNDLPACIRCSDSIASFKSAAYKFYLSKDS
jgi:hypothetical protein